MKANEGAGGSQGTTVFRLLPIWARWALAVAFVNWFVFFGVSVYLGGDAIGVYPSRDGFVVQEKGQATEVSEAVWLFSLCYTTLTLLLTPGAIMFIVLRYRAYPHARMPEWMKWFASILLTVWTAGWFFSITRAFFGSLGDWLGH